MYFTFETNCSGEVDTEKKNWKAQAVVYQISWDDGLPVPPRDGGEQEASAPLHGPSVKQNRNLPSRKKQ